MKGRLIQNLSANVTQLILNQLLGFGIFYILSTSLDKNSFGQINLALAISMVVFNILSCGIDQLVIKKIAAGANVNEVVSLYICHVLFTGIVFYALLLPAFLFSHPGQLYSLLLLIGIGKLMIYFSTPFKQAVNGMEKFRLLAYMSVVSNFVRCLGLTGLYFFHSLGITTIIMVFISGDVMELAFCIYLYTTSAKIALTIKWKRRNYVELLREALPQTGVVLITSALARFDWIFIGLMISAIKLAEYSFAYKLFEISTLPLLAIAPLLIPRFTKMFQQTGIPIGELKFLLQVEMAVAAFTALMLNMCWSPVIDGITSGKYGMVNIKTIFILSLCLPLLYLNNFLWSIYFAQGRLKMILRSFIFTFLVNVSGDIVLIPFFKNEGAAFAFFAACVVQAIYYLRQGTIVKFKTLWQPFIVCSLCALFSGFTSKMLFHSSWAAIIPAVILYVFLLFLFKNIRPSDQYNLKSFLNS